MPDISLANDVKIEYDEDTVKSESDYQFFETVPELGDFAVKGATFSLKTRNDPKNSAGYVYTFVTQETNIRFKLEQDTFDILIEDGAIIKLA